MNLKVFLSSYFYACIYVEGILVIRLFCLIPRGHSFKAEIRLFVLTFSQVSSVKPSQRHLQKKLLGDAMASNPIIAFYVATFFQFEPLNFFIDLLKSKDLISCLKCPLILVIKSFTFNLNHSIVTHEDGAFKQGW